MKTERSIQEVESLLLDSNSQKSNGGEQLAKTLSQQVDTEQQQVSPRLLRQRDLSVEIDDLEPVPYYKRGWVQIACVSMITIPLGWMLISAFSPQNNSNSPAQANGNPEDREKQLLKESLEQERKKNQDLAFNNGLKTQQIEFVRVESKSPTKPKPPAIPERKPPQVIPRTPAPLYVRPASNPAPLAARSISRPTMTTKPRVPKPSPMEQWLAASRAGSYSSNSSRAKAQNTSDPTDARALGTDTATQEQKTLTDIDNHSDWQPNGGSTPARRSNSSLERNPAMQLASNPTERESYSISPETRNSVALDNLVPGTQAKAKLLTGLSWRANNSMARIRKSIEIELSEPLKNLAGNVVFPKGTRLIARVDEADSTGQIKLSVFGLRYANRKPERIPERTILVLNRDTDDEWLQAKIPRRSNLLEDAGTVAASIFSSENDIAREAIQYANNRNLLRQISQPDTAVFVLSKGTKLRIYVNGAPRELPEDDTFGTQP